MRSPLFQQLKEESLAFEELHKEIPRGPVLLDVAPKLIVSILDGLPRPRLSCIGDVRNLWKRGMRKGRLAVRELKVVREKIDAQLDRYDLIREANWTARTRVKWLELWTARKAALPIMTRRKLISIMWSAAECAAWSVNGDRKSCSRWSQELQRTYKECQKLLRHLKVGRTVVVSCNEAASSLPWVRLGYSLNW